MKSKLNPLVYEIELTGKDERKEVVAIDRMRLHLPGDGNIDPPEGSLKMSGDEFAEQLPDLMITTGGYAGNNTGTNNTNNPGMGAARHRHQNSRRVEE